MLYLEVNAPAAELPGTMVLHAQGHVSQSMAERHVDASGVELPETVVLTRGVRVSNTGKGAVWVSKALQGCTQLQRVQKGASNTVHALSPRCPRGPLRRNSIMKAKVMVGL